MQRFTALLMALLFVAASAEAQSSGANILGTVADATGAVVPGATLTATNVDTNFSRSAQTDGTGDYLLQYLPVGTYRLEAKAEGFKTFTQRGVVLELGRNARIDPRLELGSVTEVIEVTSDPPLVETTNASLGQTVNNRDILNLPLVNRNVYDLLSLTAGVDQTNDEFTFGQPGQLTTINGSANSGGGGVNYTLDGGGNVQGLRGTGNPAPNPDAVQEFRVTTNSFNAEHGRFAGGVVQVITKSGTNEIHGSLFEFLRNDTLNAKEWSATEKAPLRRNQFGGTVGGPIVKNKLFTFGSYAGLRQRESAFFNDAVVPTQLERGGDFSASAPTLTDPNTDDPFPGNVIPATRLDPTAQNVIRDWIPMANLPNQFFELQQAVPTDTDEAIGKLDYYVSDKHQLAGTYFYTDGRVIEAIRGNLPWNRRQFLWTQHNLNLSETWTAGPSTVNQFNATYVRHFGGRLNTPQISIEDFGSNFRVQGPKALPLIDVDDYFELDTPIAGPTAGSNYYQLRDTVTWLRGKHALKVGGEVSLEKIIHDTTLDNYGEFHFRDINTGDALGDFLIGNPREMRQDAPILKTDDAWYTGFFVQDDWRMHPRFMLNLGLRYEIQFPPVDPQDRKNIFIPGRQSTVIPNAPPGMLFPGDPGITRGVIPKDTNNFSPRVGFAWDPTGDGKTSVRGAFGVFYGSIGGNNANGAADRPPFTLRERYRNVDSMTNPYHNFQTPFPYSYNPSNPIFVFPVRMKSRDLDFRWPYTYQMNFSVQRELFNDFSVTAAYVSTLTHKVPVTIDANYPIITPDATVPVQPEMERERSAVV